MNDVFEDLETADRFLEVLESERDDWSKVIAQIPGLFGSSKRATFLSYRAIGLTERQVCSIMELSRSTPSIWRKNQYFKDFEYTHLYELQSTISTRLIHLGFVRNMIQLLVKDSALIRKAFTDDGLMEMTDREFALYKHLRGQYTASELLNIEKALAPEKHKENLIINLTWNNGEQIETVQNIPLLVSGKQDEDELGG
mgnify:CR=1 FL=1